MSINSINSNSSSSHMTVTITDREKLRTDGVTDIKSFNEDEVILCITNGFLFIGGSDLKIEKLSVETGEVAVTGSIDSVFFSQGVETKQRGLFSHLFK
ncbi:MAG: YabP/YqfC family sporulation protein [Oscillospiraceae bacterium]|nr:YabP/YqfC family sporulation protein [Oscillospiraceae bacterium]